MQSFSILKRTARDFFHEARDRSPASSSSKERTSKRQLLKDLIRNTKYSPNSATGSRDVGSEGIAVSTTGEAQPSSSPPPDTGLSPRQIPNPNKPLPSPPTPGTVDKADGPSKNPVLKLDRIMATLNDADVEKLFSGAPQFFARSLGHGSGAPNPSVAFPWDEDLRIRDLTDHAQLEDNAWGCVTAAPRIIKRDPMSAATPTWKKRPHFNARVRERPNMLSMQGLEKGTMGYQAALELSVADALQEEQYGFGSLGSKAPVIVEQRQKLITSKDALRHMDDAAIMEQLLRCEDRYLADYSEMRLQAHQLYNDLFVKILHPPTKVIDREDPHSLAVQIHALVKILAAPNAWIDFSHVEWRIRLGQVLWAFPLDDELSDGSSINEGADARDRGEERYWLLLQILLACELLIRLDAITEGDEFGSVNLRASEVHKFEKEANLSVKWSLLLARTWLENISISKTDAPSSGTSTPKGWLSSLTNRMSLRHDHMHGSHHVDHMQHHAHSEYQYAIKGRYVERQVFGLTQFARKLRWPDIESYITQVSINAPTMSRATPINTPLPTSDTRRSSYFGGELRPTELKRTLSRRPKVEAALHLSGWLSKSYCSGLVLPGESLSHFLMSTLLENDQGAIARLGPMANLCGGFVYSGKSFWSTACVVGRVLAAGKGSAECMGWVSTDITPKGLGDGWLDINIVDVPEDVAKTGRKARLWGKVAIERESDVLGDAESSNVLPADFIIPHENNHAKPPPSNIRIDFQTLNLDTSTGSVNSTPSIERDMTPFSDFSHASEIPTYFASLAFTLTHDGLEQGKEVTFSLTKDIYFVTAHPCTPSNYVKYLKSPTSPTIQQIDIGENNWNGKSSNSAYITGHPLHKYYSYTTVHLTDILANTIATLDDLLGSRPTLPSTATSSSSAQKSSRVLVIDCITGFAPPSSPELASLSRMSSISSSFGLESPSPPLQTPTPPREPATRPGTTESTGSRVSRIDPPSPNANMKLPTRRRQFGSDTEILVRAICAEKGWNAVISRRRRGCLACAIREAGALGWKVIIRVD